MPVDEIAELFSVDDSTVYRWLKDADRPAGQPAQEAIDRLLGEQTLDAVGDTLAALARQLAVKIDKAATSDIAQDSIALPALTKELRGVITEIMGASADDKEWLSDLFGTVGDTENPGT